MSDILVGACLAVEGSLAEGSLAEGSLAEGSLAVEDTTYSCC